MSNGPIENAVTAARRYLEALAADGYVIEAVEITARVSAPMKEITVTLERVDQYRVEC